MGWRSTPRAERRVTPSSRGRGARLVPAHPGRHPRAAVLVEQEPELAAPPEHVLGADRPLPADEVVQLGLVQPGCHLAAQPLGRGRPVQHPLRARAVGAGEAAGQPLVEPGVPRPEGREEAREVGARDVAARQVGLGGPGPLLEAHHGLEPRQRVLGELAVGRELAAEDREQRRPAVRGVEVEHVVAGHRRRVAPRVVVERPHARVRPDHVPGRGRPPEVAVHDAAEVLGLLGRDAHLRGRALMGHVGGADQGEPAEVGDREHDPLVDVLEDVGPVVLEQPRHDDVAALDQPDPVAAVQRQLVAEEGRDPGPRGVDERPRPHLAPALGTLQHGEPAVALAPGAGAAGAGADLRSPLGRVHRVEHHEPRVVDPRVTVGEAAPEVRLERRPLRGRAEVDGGRARQQLAPAQVVVEQEPQPDQPRRPLLGRVGQDERERADDVRGRAQQHLALDQRLPDQPELVVLEVAQAAVDELGGPGGGVAREVVLLAEADGEAPSRRVAGDAHAVDPAADDEQVERRPWHPAHRLPPRLPARPSPWPGTMTPAAMFASEKTVFGTDGLTAGPPRGAACPRPA
jgi:hypothetical protein